MRAYNLLKLTKRYGSPLTLVKTTIGPYNPDKGSTSNTTENFIFTGYLYNSEEGILLDDIRRGTSKCVIPALNLGTVPDDGDQVIGLGSTKNITRVQTYYSNGVTLCYVCEVAE